MTEFELADKKNRIDDWKVCKLGEVAQLSKNAWKIGDEVLPYIGLEHIDENKLRLNGVGFSSDVASNKYHFNQDSFLFGKLRPYFRKLIKPKFQGICSTDIWVVKSKEGNDLNYLFYLFSTEEFIDLSYSGSSGTRMPRADWSFMKETSWKIPPLPEQKAIAEILSSLDDKIDLLNRQNKTLESLAETLFRHYFIDNAKDDWEEKELGNVVNIKYGKNLPTNKLTKNGYPVFGGNGKIGYYTEYKYQKPQVLISCRGEASGKVNISDPQSFITNNSLVLEIKDECFLTFEWLKFYALSMNFRDYTSGSAQPQITIDGLYQAPITFPQKQHITNFTYEVKPMEQKRLKNQKQIQTLEKLRDTLLPKLISGDVRTDYHDNQNDQTQRGTN